MALSTDAKGAYMDQVRRETSLAQARTLIEKVSENCYEKCVPKPGASLSSGEQQCLTQCMEKYMNAWNTVSRQYIGRMQQEAARQGQSDAFV